MYVDCVSDYFDIPLLKPALILTNWFVLILVLIRWNEVCTTMLYLLTIYLYRNVIMNLINYEKYVVSTEISKGPENGHSSREHSVCCIGSDTRCNAVLWVFFINFLESSIHQLNWLQNISPNSKCATAQFFTIELCVVVSDGNRKNIQRIRREKHKHNFCGKGMTFWRFSVLLMLNFFSFFFLCGLNCMVIVIC